MSRCHRLPPQGTPITVEITRGALVESRHLVSAVIADANGHVIGHWGEIAAIVYPRSAIKAVQALAIVETGADEAWGFDRVELALACASHNGEPDHVARVEALLKRLGRDDADLACGCQRPARDKDLLALSGLPRQSHNNCSGKHAGMLATALHCGEAIRGYQEASHPVQQRILGILEQMTGQDIPNGSHAIDGCGIPTYPVPIGGLAVGMARLADPAALPDQRRLAVEKICRAWGGAPWYVAGTGRFDTAVMTALKGRVLSKTGAEGVHCLCLPEMGLGVALKVADGGQRAADMAAIALLDHLGAIDATAQATLAEWLQPKIRNRTDQTVGGARIA